MRTYNFYVYILTNSSNKVLYTGVTNDLIRRCVEHKLKVHKGFTSRYNVHKLVYYELFDQIENAIFREKQIKAYNRQKRLNLINSFNPEWRELFADGQIIEPTSANLNPA